MQVDITEKTVGSFNFEFLRGISSDNIQSYDIGECLNTMNQIKDGNFESWVLEWADAWELFSLHGLVDKYLHPMLFLFGEDDIKSSFTHSPALISDLLDFMLSLKCEKTIRLFTRDEGVSGHCQMGGILYANTSIFQWLNYKFQDGIKPQYARTEAKERFIELFGEYGGAKCKEKAAALIKTTTFI